MPRIIPFACCYTYRMVSPLRKTLKKLWTCSRLNRWSDSSPSPLPMPWPILLLQRMPIKVFIKVIISTLLMKLAMPFGQFKFLSITLNCDKYGYTQGWFIDDILVVWPESFERMMERLNSFHSIPSSPSRPLPQKSHSSTSPSTRAADSSHQANSPWWLS